MVQPIIENAIGIDLGTTNCCVGHVRDDNVVIIPSVSDERTTPSYIFFGETSLVGKIAESNVVLYPENVVYDAKRMIGRSFLDENVQKNLPYWGFRVDKGFLSKPEIIVPVRNTKTINTYAPEDISAMILQHLKHLAEKFIGQPVTQAVITVPAYFNYNQRTMTQKAAETAGLKVLQIINEPTAAALAYVDSNYRNKNVDKTVLIYDLGGGTFDVSIIRISKRGKEEKFDVLATSGNTYLGGRDFDNNLYDLIIQKIREKDIQIDKIVRRRVAAQVTRIKVELSEAESTEVLFDFLCSEEEDCPIKIFRKEFESVNDHLFQSTIEIVETTLTDGNISKEKIDEVVLVGGSSKIPRIKEIITKFFDGKTPSEAISCSEAVAYGAAIKAAAFDKNSNKVLVIADVTPLSLGTDIIGDRMSFVIKRNTRIPTQTRTTRYAVKTNQTSMSFCIYEGERPLVQHNTKLGSFDIEFPPKPLGRPVDVIFDIDENGVLHVGAEVDSKIYKNIKITYSPTDVAKAASVIEEAVFHKTKDETELRKVNRFVAFRLYLRRVEALCKYKSRLTATEKEKLRHLADENLIWLDKFDENNLSDEDDRQIIKKTADVENVCEPIFKKYKYKVKEVGVGDFYVFLLTLEEE